MKGFLLTRIELPDVSEGRPRHCSAQAQYSKAVVLIVDALRYDFVCEVSSNLSTYKGRLPKTLAHMAAAVSIKCKWCSVMQRQLIDRADT